MKNKFAPFGFCVITAWILSACFQKGSPEMVAQLYAKGEYKDVIDAYLLNKNDFDNNIFLLNIIGISFQKSGKYQESIELFDKAIKIDSSLPDLYSNKCLTFVELGKYDDAVSYCNKALEIDSLFAFAYLNRSYARIRLSDFLKALHDANKSIEIGITDTITLSQAYANKSTAYLNLGNFDAAHDSANSAIRYNKKSLTGYKVRSISLFMKGDVESGMRDLDKGLSIKNDDTDLLYYKGLIMAKQGNKTIGCQLIKKAILLNNSTALNSQDKMTKNFKKYCD